MKRYKTSLEQTREFIECKYSAPDIEIQKPDYEFISEYAFWLKTARKCNHNTAVRAKNGSKKIPLKTSRSKRRK
ncbi:phage integrase SAM-like domain-containing protein [Ravibacter arvi]|uniref:phage integrase SAM-like domain-containing protein n=1 Tax=Ravibacter arvi TaxID=2051041 RepID=UPI003CD0C1C9